MSLLSYLDQIEMSEGAAGGVCQNAVTPGIMGLLFPVLYRMPLTEMVIVYLARTDPSAVHVAVIQKLSKSIRSTPVMLSDILQAPSVHNPCASNHTQRSGSSLTKHMNCDNDHLLYYVLYSTHGLQQVTLPPSTIVPHTFDSPFSMKV